MSAGRRAAILVVDDRPEQRLALGAMLADLDAEVVEAASGHDALRWLLRREFAVILLDVNMAGLDGFETAALIRQRRSSQHTPIIFVTAYGDDTHAARGYSLGAVDYILTPIEPQILRTKVSVFLELFRQTEELSRNAESLRRHATQFRYLADAAIAVHAAESIDDLLKVVADTAASIVGARQVAIEVDTRRLGSRARHAIWWPERTCLDALGRRALDGMPPHALRMSRAELDGDVQWGGFERPEGFLPLRGWLAAPLSRRDGSPIGWVQLSEKETGDFSAEDETLVVQLAQMASIAVENLLLNDAQEANRLKDQFLATLSHELRTPLQAILSWSRILRDPAVDSGIVPQGLEVIERNARAQTRLIEDLLDVSRIITGKLVIEKRPLRLADVVAAAVEDAQPAAFEKQIEIRSESAAEPWVSGDPARLRQVLDNLISNAIKFTPAGGRVTVTLDVEGGQARISVRDTGRGIEPEFLPHLFERFRQADSATTRSAGGLGIGLAIVAHLVELHGGWVHAESEGLGHGANLVLRFPLASPTAEQLHDEERVPVLPVKGRPLEGLRVLLVEDEADSRDCLALALGHNGAEVIAVSSAREALVALDEKGTDVLLSDLAMPDQDGYSLIREIRARPSERCGAIPAAAISAYARAEDRAHAVFAGFDLHLSKPIDPADVVGAIRDLVARLGSRAGAAPAAPLGPGS